MRLLVAQLLNRVGLFVTSWSVHGILQVRILECVAIPISRVSSQRRDRTWTPALQVNSLPSKSPGKPIGQKALLRKDLS